MLMSCGVGDRGCDVTLGIPLKWNHEISVGPQDQEWGVHRQRSSGNRSPMTFFFALLVYFDKGSIETHIHKHTLTRTRSYALYYRRLLSLQVTKTTKASGWSVTEVQHACDHHSCVPVWALFVTPASLCTAIPFIVLDCPVPSTLCSLEPGSLDWLCQ